MNSVGNWTAFDRVFRGSLIEQSFSVHVLFLETNHYFHNHSWFELLRIFTWPIVYCSMTSSISGNVRDAYTDFLRFTNGHSILSTIISLTSICIIWITNAIFAEKNLDGITCWLCITQGNTLADFLCAQIVMRCLKRMELGSGCANHKHLVIDVLKEIAGVDLPTHQTQQTMSQPTLIGMF